MLKFIRPDLKTIPLDTDRCTVHAVVEECLADAWLASVTQEKGPWEILVSDESAFHYDIGGSVGMDEPLMSYDLGDWSLSVLVRHAEYLQKPCRRIQTHLDWLGDHIWLAGWRCHGVLTVETGEAIATWLDEELPSRIGESDQLWSEHQEAVASCGVDVMPRTLRKKNESSKII